MSPDRVILFSALTYIILWVFSPLDVIYSPSLLSLMLFFLMYFALYLGVISYSSNVPGAIKRRTHILGALQYKTGAIKLLFKVVLVLALTGLLLRFIDKFIIRDLLEYSSSVARRDSDSDSSLFGIVSAPLYSLLLVLPIFIKVLHFKWYSKTFIFILFSYPALEVVFMGSRGLVITSFVMFLMYLFLFSKNGLNIIKIIIIFLLAFVLFHISVTIFLDRIEAYGMDPLYSAFNSGYAFTLVPNDFAVSVIENNTAFYSTVFGLVNFSQYYLHGLLEFSYLIDHFGSYHFMYGQYTFSIFNKLLSTIGMVDPVDVFDVTPRYGVYTTLLGPLWVDFGLGSILFIYLLGFFYAHIYFKVLSGGIFYYPMFAYLTAVVFFMPVVNLIQNALGVYVFVACVLLVSFSRLLVGKSAYINRL